MAGRRRASIALALVLLGTFGVMAASGAETASPVIVSVTLDGTPQNPEFVLAGRSFGTKPEPSRPPAESPYCTTTNPGDLGLNFGDKLYFLDETADLEAGRSSEDDTDCVGLIVKEYTATRIAYTLGSFYRGNFEIRDGDAVTFFVNGTSLKLAVRYGRTIANTAVCVVPKVLKLTLAKATTTLRKARCALGKVTRPKQPPKRVLVVKSQRPAANAAVPAGTKVAVTLG